jgi:hypothetical protein
VSSSINYTYLSASDTAFSSPILPTSIAPYSIYPPSTTLDHRRSHNEVVQRSRCIARHSTFHPSILERLQRRRRKPRRLLQNTSPMDFTSVRLYASSDCNTLALAVPAAIATKTQLLVGVWTQDDAHFKREKDALESAIKKYGQDWIIAISVGSEDLYRKEVNPGTLATKIYDVRGMVRAMGVKKDVGHVGMFCSLQNISFQTDNR